MVEDQPIKAWIQPGNDPGAQHNPNHWIKCPRSCRTGCGAGAEPEDCKPGCIHPINPDHPDKDGRKHQPDNGEIRKENLADGHLVIGHLAFLEEDTKDTPATSPGMIRGRLFDLMCSNGISLPHRNENTYISPATRIPPAKKQIAATRHAFPLIWEE